MANFHSQIASRIPNANYNDSLSSETLWILIISTMKVLSFELLNSCKRRENNYWVMVYLISFVKSFIFFAVCRVYAYILCMFSFYSGALLPFWIFLPVFFSHSLRVEPCDFLIISSLLNSGSVSILDLWTHKSKLLPKTSILFCLFILFIFF